MRLFIQMRDGQPFEHPITEKNMRDVFPNMDLDNLPPEFMEFRRFQCPPPDPGKYIVSAECKYEIHDGVVRDVWYVAQVEVTPLVQSEEQEE